MKYVISNDQLRAELPLLMAELPLLRAISSGKQP